MSSGRSKQWVESRKSIVIESRKSVVISDSKTCDDVVLISCSGHNKLPQNGWLRTREISFLTVLKPCSMKSIWPDSVKYHVTSSALAVPRSLWRLLGTIIPCLFQIWWLLASLGLWPHHFNLCFCLHITFFSWCTKAHRSCLL